MDIINSDITALVSIAVKMCDMAEYEEVSRLQMYELSFDMYSKISLHVHCTNEKINLLVRGTSLTNNEYRVEHASLLLDKWNNYPLPSTLASAVTDVLDSLLTALGYSIS